MMNQSDNRMYKYAVKRIENCWCCYRDKQMFKLLKHAVSTSDHSLTADIMRKINPNEAELLKDPVFKTKIRFRFAGEEFPPHIVFKVFIETNGAGVKYLCGKKVIKPASQAAVDSCSLMGNRKFLNQILTDMCEEDQRGLQDETDISSMKDYMKYLATLDENSPESGGKANTWRTLTLDVVPRNHIISDVLVYLQHKTKTQNFIDYFKSTKSSHIIPLTQAQQVEYIKLLQNRKLNEPGRRTKQAKQRVAKMRKLYKQRDESECIDDTSPPISPTYNHNNAHHNDGIATYNNNNGARNDDDIVPLSPLVRNEDIDFEDELWEDEGKLLFEWTQNLSVTNLASR